MFHENEPVVIGKIDLFSCLIKIELEVKEKEDYERPFELVE